MKIKNCIKNLCPKLAMISAGKTIILKVLFDIDFLEISAEIGNKLINIIRHNHKIGKKLKFYHLKLKNIGNGDYEYYKDLNFQEVIGKEEIKQANEKIFEEFRSKMDQVPYEELFFMIELGESDFIEDKEFLKNYDLIDIQGVIEYNINQTPEEKPNEKLLENEEYKDLEAANAAYEKINNKEKNYLTEIFRIIKNKMNNGIIVFLIYNYQHVENYRIIGKLQKVINKPIENFLIFLNKIDKSEKRELDLSTLNNKIMKYFPSAKIFNNIKNSILLLSTIQLENESKMSKDFKCFLDFHYINYINYLMKNKKTNASSYNKCLNFIDFLKDIKIKKNFF